LNKHNQQAYKRSICITYIKIVNTTQQTKQDRSSQLSLFSYHYATGFAPRATEVKLADYVFHNVFFGHLTPQGAFVKLVEREWCGVVHCLISKESNTYC
jgi:hypothetical protein